MAVRMNTPSLTQYMTVLGNRSLPIFLTRQNKYLVGFVFYCICLALYLSSNHFHIFTPKLLPFSWVDHLIPFIPESVWIYVSDYFFFAVVYIICKDLENLNKLIYSFFFLQTVSVLIFWFLPTTYPRDLFPLPGDLDLYSRYVFESLRVADTPANCCPSLHVSGVFLASFIFLKHQKEKFPFFFAWAVAIAVSTLTTKQHYLIDVITGFMMAVGTQWIFDRFVTYQSVYKVGRQAKR